MCIKCSKKKETKRKQKQNKGNKTNGQKQTSACDKCTNQADNMLKSQQKHNQIKANNIKH
jgi:hypothetical protein